MISIIALEQGRYYVGQYTIPEIQSGSGPTWVKTYKPVRLIKQVSDSFEFETLIEYMETYGINYVRGSRYTSMELSSYDREILNKSLFKKVNDSSNSILNKSSSEDEFKQISYAANTNKISNVKLSSVSYDKSYTCTYCEMEFDNNDILKRHEHLCKDKAFVRSSGKDLNCERCGRNTHSTINCRARTDIYGYDTYDTYDT
jgi:hypothetical protein